MPESNVFRWLDGNGWLVFSGGADDAVRASAFSRTAADGGLAVIAVSGDGELLLSDLQDLGAPSCYLVDPAADEDPVILDKLTGAGMVLVTGAESARAARAALSGAPLEGMQIAYDHGAVILIEGAAIGAFGGWSADDERRDGLDWLEGAILLVEGADTRVADEVLIDVQHSLLIRVAPGSAIAFAADGAVELWGNRQVRVRLSGGYTTP